MKNPPSPILEAIERSPGLVSSDAFIRWRPEGERAMRSDHQETMLKVILCLLRACCLQFGGMFCRVQDDLARSMVVAEVAKFCEISERTVERCLAELIAMGYLNSEKQYRQVTRGGLIVAPCRRLFTLKFWNALGLAEKFVLAVKREAEKMKLVFRTTRKFIPRNLEERTAVAMRNAKRAEAQGKGGGPIQASLILANLALGLRV